MNNLEKLFGSAETLLSQAESVLAELKKEVVSASDKEKLAHLARKQSDLCRTLDQEKESLLSFLAAICLELEIDRIDRSQSNGYSWGIHSPSELFGHSDKSGFVGKQPISTLILRKDWNFDFGLLCRRMVEEIEKKINRNDTENEKSIAAIKDAKQKLSILLKGATELAPV